MRVVILTSIIAFFLAYLASFRKLKYGLEACFFILAFVSAIHYNYGNDYNTYFRIFQDAQDAVLSWSSAKGVFRDPGWVLLCRLFKPFGFFGLIVVISVIENLIFYFFIRDNVAGRWRLLSVFIYIFGTNFFLLNLSTIRQGFAVALCVLTFYLLKKNRIGLSVILVFLAATIHSTSIVFAPFLFVYLLPLRNTRLISVVVASLFVLLLFSIGLIDSVLSRFSVFYSFDDYLSVYQFTSGTSFGIGFIADCIPFLVFIWFLFNNTSATKEEKYIAIIASVGSLIVPFQQRYSIIGRVGFFFNAYYLAAIPLVYKYLKIKSVRFALICVFVLLIIYRYWQFFTVGSFVEYYSQPFHTIFEVPWQ